MSSEAKALRRLKITSEIIQTRGTIQDQELEDLMFMQFGVLPRTVARYVGVLERLKKIRIEGQELKWIPS